MLKDLVQFALDQHTEFRRFKNYPLDPPYVTKKIEEEPSFKDAIENIKKELTELSCRLNNSIPFFSFRSQVMAWLLPSHNHRSVDSNAIDFDRQGHMLWDTTIASNVGYIAALLYNQNNVASMAR